MQNGRRNVRTCMYLSLGDDTINMCGPQRDPWVTHMEARKGRMDHSTLCRYFSCTAKGLVSPHTIPGFIARRRCPVIACNEGGRRETTRRHPYGNAEVSQRRGTQTGRL